MNKGVRKVRQSIKQRKKQRDKMEIPSKNTLPFIVSEQEKHGYEAPLYDVEKTAPLYKAKEQEEKPILFMKLVTSVGLFLVLAFLLQTNIPALTKPQQWVQQSLHDEFPFAKVNEWYVTTFGNPMSITPGGQITTEKSDVAVLPVMGDVVETFAANGSGIMIAPLAEKSSISAIDRGVVVFAGNDKKTDKTIVIQHADGSHTTYGLLSSIDVHLYQTVAANQVIATFLPTAEKDSVYFSVEKNHEYIDPSKVIPVDDMP